jgi:hypothetical protein
VGSTTAEHFLSLVAAGCGPDTAVNQREQWIVVRPPGAADGSRTQGWKLHVSAHPANAHTVLARCLPVLSHRQCRFKVASSAAVVAELNAGIGGPSQIGKFLTVYPATEIEAVQIASDLDTATRGLSGPAIPSDRRLSPGSLVHYRFGSFGGTLLQLPDGTVAPALTTPDGEVEPDERHAHFKPPAWAIDPFPAGEMPEALPSALAATKPARFCVVDLLSNSGRGSVLLGVDLVAQRRCVLKTAHRGCASDEGEAAVALRTEAAVLQQLGPETGRPAFYDLLELDEELVLVMEDIAGRVLADEIGEVVLRGRLPPATSVARVGRQLALMVAGIHQAGLVYRDLKSSNVVICHDGAPRLLDFELAAAPGTGPRGAGTRGYMSPQQWAGEPSTWADDIYGLGALLFFLATGADPCRAPDPRNLLIRPLRLLNPSVSAGLADTITCCLDPDPGRRPASMAVVAEALARIEHTPAISRSRDIDLDPAERRHQRSGTFARRLGDTLCDDAVDVPRGSAIWISTAPGSLRIPYRQINNGVPGAILALTELWRAFGIERHRDTLVRACAWLADSAPLPGARIAGLYAGEAGVGAALLRAGQVLGEEKWIADARRCEERLREYPYEMPDMFHGTAGRLRFVMMLWEHTGDAAVLTHAARCADQLLASATAPGVHELCWTIPSGYGGFSGMTEPSYAHGASGIADALLDLYEATRDPALLDAAMRAARWVEHQAVTTLSDDSGLDWGHHAGFSGLWCYGASGVGRLFLRLARFAEVEHALRVAERAGHTVARAGRHAGTSRCHGLSGSIEYLLDLYQATANERWLTEAWYLESLLRSFCIERNGQTRWLSDDGHAHGNSAYMVGYAGVALTLLRLWDLHRFPHQLTLEGFRSAPRATSPAG